MNTDVCVDCLFVSIFPDEADVDFIHCDYSGVGRVMTHAHLDRHDRRLQFYAEHGYKPSSPRERKRLLRQAGQLLESVNPLGAGDGAELTLAVEYDQDFEKAADRGLGMESFDRYVQDRAGTRFGKLASIEINARLSARSIGATPEWARLRP